MKNEEWVEIQKHTSFLVEQFEYQLQSAAHEVMEEYGLEPEDLDYPGELAPEDYNEGSALEHEDVLDDWRFVTDKILRETTKGVVETFELNKASTPHWAK